MAKFDSILGTIGNTPVVRINKFGPKGINSSCHSRGLLDDCFED